MSLLNLTFPTASFSRLISLFYFNEILIFNIDQLANTKTMQSNESAKFCQRLT